MKICLIIPAYNEEKRIGPTLEELKRTLLKRYGSNVTIIIVSDGSTDGTDRLIRRYQKGIRQIRLVSSSVRAGKGNALIKGFYIACEKYKPDIIGFVDADSSVPGGELVRLIEMLHKGKMQGVIASRYLKNSKLIGDLGRKRYYASRGYNAMVRLLFGIRFRDTQCGAKFFKAGAIRDILGDMQLTDLSFDINLLYEMKRRKFDVAEVPITYKVMLEGTKVSVRKQIPKMFIVTLGYRITRSPLNRVIPKGFKETVYSRVRRW